MPYDFNAAGSYIKTEPYARNVRDEIGDAFIAMPGSIQENTEATFQTNKPAFKAEILADLEPTAVAAEVITAREAFTTLDARLDFIENGVASCSTAGATAGKTATKPGFTLKTGKIVAVKFSNANLAANPTLNIESTGTKNITIKGGNIPSKYYWDSNATILFVFNGTSYDIVDLGVFGIAEKSAPVGEVVDFAGSILPNGWLWCDGAAVSRTTYADLFATISTLYGAGNGSTTFNVPNTKGRVIVSRDSADPTFSVVGATGGAKTHTLTTNEIPSHAHAQNVTANPGTGAGVRHDYDSDGANLGSFPQGITTDFAGGGQAHNNLQPYIVFNKIIKF